MSGQDKPLPVQSHTKVWKNIIKITLIIYHPISLRFFSFPFPPLPPGRDLPQQPSAEAQACVSWLAHLVVRLQEQGSLISPWSLMSCLLLQAPAAALTEEGLPWQRLAQETLWLRELAKDFGARLNWPGRWISNVKNVVICSGSVAAVNGRNFISFDEGVLVKFALIMNYTNQLFSQSQLRIETKRGRRRLGTDHLVQWLIKVLKF